MNTMQKHFGAFRAKLAACAIVRLKNARPVIGTHESSSRKTGSIEEEWSDPSGLMSFFSFSSSARSNSSSSNRSIISRAWSSSLARTSYRAYCRELTRRLQKLEGDKRDAESGL